MKTLDKLFVLAAALLLAPTAALAQPAAPPAAAPVAAAPASATGNTQSPVDIGPRATPVAGIGQPDGRAHLQEQFTPIGTEAAWFHDWILLPLISIISAFVLFLLLFVVVRFRRSAHPVPSRSSHNTLLEIVWTLVPVLILVAIAIPSIRLLAHQYSPPKADLTVKVTGNQWYWTYSYPDNGDFEITSRMLKEQGHTGSG